MRPAKWVALCLSALLLLSACHDGIELTDRAFVIGFAIDKEGDNVSVTLSIANVEAVSDRGDPEDLEELLEAEAPSLAAAMREVNNGVSSSVFFGHAKLLVLGENLLKDPIKLENVLDTLQRNNEINHRIIVLAAENASETLDYEKNKEPLLGFFVQNFFENNDAPVPQMDLEVLINKMRTGQTALIPMINLDEGVEISGAAVVDDFEFIGWLDEEEAIGLAWFLGKPAGAVVTTDDAAFEVIRSRRKVRFVERSGVLHCYITLTVNGNLTSGKGDNRNLQNEFEREIADILMTTFEKLYCELNTDGFGLREKLRRQNRRLYLEHGDNIADTVEFNVGVTVRLVDSGAVK